MRKREASVRAALSNQRTYMDKKKVSQPSLPQHHVPTGKLDRLNTTLEWARMRVKLEKSSISNCKGYTVTAE